MLTPGSKLLHYELLAPLGAGAMGEVYRAKDSKLGREVAIKVLPEHFAADEERLKRFEREAKTLASLNHPNVAQIFGVDQVGDTCFLVLELVPGESLEERLKRGPLSLNESLDVCKQIADGLAAAHEAGVIHRDLKPANVRITPEGKVKLLDFGLAKPAREGQSGSSTDSVLSTEAGRLLGTPTYMAPEQARGKAIDKRVDIWAFGCVLYECLTARRAFAGETLSDVFAAVLEHEPDWSKLPPATPPRVRELLRRTTAKDPRARLRDIGDAPWELASSGQEQSPVVAGRHGRLARVLTFLAGAGLAAALLFFTLNQEEPAPQRTRRFVHFGTNLTIDSVQGLALSHDGGRLVYRARNAAGQDQLFVHPLDSFEATPLAGTEQGYLPFFSPGDEELGFAVHGELRVLTLSTGSVRTLTALPRGFSGGVWLSDGTILWTSTIGRQLGRVAAVGGTPEYLDVGATDEFELVVAPSALPDEQALLLGARSGGGFQTLVFDLESRKTTVIAEGFTPVFAPGGFVLYQRSEGPLMALPFDHRKRVVLGQAFPVVADMGPRVSTHVRMFALAGDGTLAYLPKSVFADRGMLVSVDRKGIVEPILTVGKVVDNPRYSRDGRRLAFRTPAPFCELWVHDLERGVTTRITQGGDNHGNVWLPDDTRIATMHLARPPVLMTCDAGGAGGPVELFAPETPFGFASSCSPDGRYLLFGTQSEPGADVYLADLEQRSSRPLLHAPGAERAAVFSPDGKYIAYTSDEEGQEEVYVQSFPALDVRRKVSVQGGKDPAWSRDGTELFFLSGRTLMAAAVRTAPSLSSARPEPLFVAEFVESWNSGLASYDPSPDGQHFVMVRQRSGTLGAEMHVVLDWLPELRARDPRNAAR